MATTLYHKMRYAAAVDYRERFIELLADNDVVRFGDFTLKSGRKSPYFINAGQIRTGAAILGLGDAYAARIEAAALPLDFVFGPSYKGVPLAVATAISLAESGADVGFAFDRKEAKEHGEGGRFVGTQPEAGMRAIVIDDVITSGASIRHSLDLLRAAAVEVTGVVVAVDREERGRGTKSTLRELEESLAVPILPIVTVRAMVERLHGSGRLSDASKKAIEDYIAEHGPRASE